MNVQSLKTLAQALGITLVELMRSERNPEAMLTKEAASQALSETGDAARRQYLGVFRRLAGWTAGILAAAALWFALTGLMPRTDVFVYEYAVLPSGGAITLHTGLAGSMGYVRSCRNVSQDPRTMTLVFSSAFGGLNSRLGAQNVFTLRLEECRQIEIARSDGAEAVLIRNQTGEWVRAE